jgi:hypothetical protein
MPVSVFTVNKELSSPKRARLRDQIATRETKELEHLVGPAQRETSRQLLQVELARVHD